MRSEREVEQKTLIIGNHFQKCIQLFPYMWTRRQLPAWFSSLAFLLCPIAFFTINCIGKRSLSLDTQECGARRDDICCSDGWRVNAICEPLLKWIYQISEMGKDHDLRSWSSRSSLVISIFWVVKIISGDLFKWSWSLIFDLQFFKITFFTFIPNHYT